jgi:hypothetical protein
MPLVGSEDQHPRRWVQALRRVVRYGWPVALLLAILWFPFDWLATVWPAFGVPFRQVFHNAHDHFIGHTVFFFIVGMLVLTYLPALRRLPWWYLVGLVLAALMQETIQALFRGQVPTFTDFNAFKGDALGGVCAFVVWLAIEHLWHRKARISQGCAQGRGRV